MTGVAAEPGPQKRGHQFRRQRRTHHARAHAVTYLLGQTYLEPHPRELALRNLI